MTTDSRTPLELAAAAERLAWSDSPPWVLRGDAELVADLISRDRRVVLGVEAILAVGPERLENHRNNWWPLLPLADTGEITSVRDIVAASLLGSVTDLDVTVGHGRPPWDVEPTEHFAGSAFEAAIWAFHLVETIIGTDLHAAAWRATGTDLSVYVTEVHLSEDLSGRLRILPAKLVPNQSFVATIWLDRGHISIRHPLSIGRLMIWDGDRVELRSTNGGDLGPTAGNDAWPAQPLRDALRWVEGKVEPPRDLTARQDHALSVVVRVADGWPAEVSTPTNSPVSKE